MKSTRPLRAYYSSLGRLRMLGGDRALDLANTLHWRDGHEIDFIPDYDALLRWSVPARLLTGREADQLATIAVDRQADAAAILRQWLSLRAEFKAWLLQVTPWPGPGHETSPGHRTMPALDHAIAGCGSLPLQAAPRLTGKDLPLPLQRSAAAIVNLMLFPPEGTVRHCEADQCGGVFLDQSRSRPRRWCAMDSCGNRAKAEAYRHRHAP